MPPCAASATRAGTAPSPPPPPLPPWPAPWPACRAPKRDQIDRLRVPTAQVRKLYLKLAERNLAARRKITGIGPRRAEIIVPGVAVLLEFLQEFHLPAVYYSRAGVRDGIIADLAARNVGAELSRLSRDQRREVVDMGRRYGVSLDARPQGRQYLQPAVHRAPAPAPNAARLRQAPGSRRLPARRGAFRQQYRPPQAFLLRGRQLRHGRLHRARAAPHRGPVPLSPQVPPQPGAPARTSRFRRKKGVCC